MTVEPSGAVVVDGLAMDGTAVVDLAAGQAVLRAAELLVVYAGTGDVPVDTARRTVRRVRSAWPGLRVRAEFARGGIFDALVDHGTGASLLVVGYADRPGQQFLPPVAAGLIGLPGAPVIVFRPYRDRHAQCDAPVLVGVTADGTADPAVGFAFVQAAAAGVPVLAEHVWSGAADLVPARAGAGRYDCGMGRAEAERALSNVVEPWSERFPDVPVRFAVRHSLDVAAPLTAGSRTAGLLVVGATRTGRFAGSTAAALLHRARCPVAIVGEH